MGEANAFVDLRRLADWFASLSARSHLTTLPIERVIHRLGTVCVPLLGRELSCSDIRRREAGRAALASLAGAASTRARVIAELRAIASGAGAANDDGKVCALGLLAELGEKAAASFSDPSGIQRRSALALAAQLSTPADIAAAADMMIKQMSDDEIVQLLDVMATATPAAAYRVGAELCARLDIAADLRERVAGAALSGDPLAEAAGTASGAGPESGSEGSVTRGRAPRPTRVEVLVDAGARLVVVASRKLPGEKRWRRWAVLIDARGKIADCVHEDHAELDGAAVAARLVADGYRSASDDYEHARAMVAAAARLSADGGEQLASAYYLGRDLLDLGEAHLGGRTHAHPISTTLGRAVELVGDGDHARARALLARCDRNDPDVAAATAACLLAQGQPADAIAHLTRAIEAEPEWPLHHWNIAAACHQLGDTRGCYHALRRFIQTSAHPTGLYADTDQPGRVALAHKLVAELERTSRLAGSPLARPRRKRRHTRRAQKT
jgi:tetratricopeptide (TPR) repeat protein